MENQSKLTNSKEIIAYLSEKFPNCFLKEGEAKPLKIGIFQDIVERLKDDPTVSKTQLRTALRLYTSSWRYLYGVRLGAQRVDLDGQSCGVLEEEHIIHAKKQLDEAKARLKLTRQSQLTVSAKTDEGLEKKRENRRPFEKRNAQFKKNNSLKNEFKNNSIAKTIKKNTPVQALDLQRLRVGQEVFVTLGRNKTEATVLEIIKDEVKVQTSSGLAMVVRAEHLAL